MRRLALCVMMMFLFFPGHTKAEDQWDFIQVTCSPEFDYFALRTMHMWRNVELVVGTDTQANILKRLESEHHMYAPERIINQPYTCTLPKRKVSVEVADYIPAKEYGECSALAHFHLVIKVDGTEVERFSAYGINRCSEEKTHLIELNSYYIQDCTLSDAYRPIEKESPIASSCKKKKL